MPENPPPNPRLPHLADWHVNPPRDPNFRAIVWSRIGDSEQPSTWSRFARMHLGAIAALMFAGFVAGAWTGSAKAEKRAAADRSAIAANYVHSLDARWMRHP